ncbi:MAG: amidohydrolase family protein [Armatimonadota bacterium]
MWIDCHMHLAAGWSTPAEIDRLVTEYRQVVDHAWLFGVHGPYCLENDAVLVAARAHPDFFIPFALVDFDGPVKQIDDFHAMGFKGLKVLSAQGPLGNDRALPYYRRAQQLGLPVVFHTGSVPAPDPALPGFGVTMDYHPLELERIARACPDLVMVALHGGGFFWREALVAALSCPNIYLTVGDFDSAAGMCLDNLASWDMVGLLETKILAGLDYPFAASICGKPDPFTPTAQVLPATIKMTTLATRLRQRLGENWRDAVMGGNARNLERSVFTSSANAGEARRIL